MKQLIESASAQTVGTWCLMLHACLFRCVWNVYMYVHCVIKQAYAKTGTFQDVTLLANLNVSTCSKLLCKMAVQLGMRHHHKKTLPDGFDSYHIAEYVIRPAAASERYGRSASLYSGTPLP